MGKGLGFVTVVIVAAIGGYLYLKQTQALTPDGTTAMTMIDVTGVRNDLLAMANAERRYWAINGKYASIGELRANGDTFIPKRENFTYSAEINDRGFRIIAAYSGPDPKAPKRISVDETMAVKTE